MVDCSTVSPAATAAIAARLRERDIGLVDAPVSGGSEGAERGTLTIFCGGTDADVARARSLLEAFGSRITHLGPSGAGQVAKAVNQVMIAGTYASVGEGIALAEAAGLDLPQLVEALSAGAAASWVLTNRAGNMIADTLPAGLQGRPAPQGSGHRPRRGGPRRPPARGLDARRGAGGRRSWARATATRT